MADIYVRSTDGDNGDDGSTWALAKANLAGAAAINAAGDVIYVSQAHTESNSTETVLSFAGTNVNPVRIICGNDAAAPPTALGTGATINSVGGGSSGAHNVTIEGNVYARGLTIDCASDAGAWSPTLKLSNGSNNAQLYESCTFRVSGVGGGGRIQMGSGNSGQQVAVTWKDCSVRFGNAGHAILPLQTKFRWSGGSIESGGAALNNFIELGADQADIVIEGVNLSNLSTTANLVATSTAGVGRVVFRNCRLPASWTGTLGTRQSPTLRVEMHNCDSTDTNYRMWADDYYGSTRTSTSVLRTGGASDGTTPISWQVITSANAGMYPINAHETPEIVAYNSTVGSSVTVSVEIAQDSAAAALTDKECWLEVQYLGTSGTPLALFASEGNANPLPAASGVAQTTSSEAWTGLTSPTRQVLLVSVTPQEVGFIHAVVRVAKASTTVFVCPKLTLA
jgi:hypothetical protein